MPYAQPGSVLKQVFSKPTEDEPKYYAYRFTEVDLNAVLFLSAHDCFVTHEFPSKYDVATTFLEKKVTTEQNAVRVENAVLGKAMVRFDGRGCGILCFDIGVSGAGWGQGLRSISLEHPSGIPFVKALTLIEVEDIECMAGTSVRIKTNGFNSPIISVGHFLKDDWLEVPND